MPKSTFDKYDVNIGSTSIYTHRRLVRFDDSMFWSGGRHTYTSTQINTTTTTLFYLDVRLSFAGISKKYSVIFEWTFCTFHVFVSRIWANRPKSVCVPSVYYLLVVCRMGVCVCVESWEICDKNGIRKRIICVLICISDRHICDPISFHLGNDM